MGEGEKRWEGRKLGGERDRLRENTLIMNKETGLIHDPPPPHSLIPQGLTGIEEGVGYHCGKLATSSEKQSETASHK